MLYVAFATVAYGPLKLTLLPFSIVSVFPDAQLKPVPAKNWPPFTVMSPLAFNVPVNVPVKSPT